MTHLAASSGFFAHHACEYEEHNLSVFPLKAKRPVVRNPQCFGLSSWRNLSPELLDARGLGMWCGKRNGITVVDFDTHDSGVVDDFIKDAGDTPIKVQTASGKLHLWYQYNGEQRQIRPIAGQDIDILGNGLAVLPPTEGNGSSYSFVEGGLNSLCRLPALAPEAVPESVYGRKDRASMREGDGRNMTLWMDGMRWAAQQKPDTHAALEMAMDVLNNQYTEPMADGEFQRTVDSVWSKHSSGKNMFGRPPEVRVPFTIMDRIDNPDALYLYMELLRAHSGIRHEFFISIKKVTFDVLGWGCPQRTRKAIALLVDAKLIVQTRPATSRSPAVYAFTVEGQP